jgi:hypothetical protein
MELTPFTFEEATDIAEDFEDLIDTDFGLDGAVYEITEVMVSPFPEEEQTKFKELYLKTKDKAKALFDYTGHEFEVLVFAMNVNDPEIATLIDIRTFSDRRGIGYNYPGH